MPTDQAELVAAAKGGDRDAFEALVKVTYHDAYTLAYRLTGNEEDARDVVQDAYLRAYRGLGRFRGDAQFTTWLYRIVANCASTNLGKRSRNRHADIDEEIGVGRVAARPRERRARGPAAEAAGRRRAA